MALRVEVNSEFMAPIAGGLKTITGRVNIAKYQLPTPYDVTFFDRSDSSIEVDARVVATTLYPTLPEYLAACWHDAAPMCESIEEAHEMYRGVVYDDGRNVFSDDKPVVALKFELK